METLQTYLECDGGMATPANTMGMGNPGETGPDTLSEPIGGIEKTAKSEVEKDKKKRKRKIKSLSESLFDSDMISKDIKFGDLFKLEDVDIRESIERPDRHIGHKSGPHYMKPTGFVLKDMYKTTLLSKDTGTKVTKDPKSIADALNKVVCDIPLTDELLKMSLYNFGRWLRDNTRKYYSSTLLHDAYLRIGSDTYVIDAETRMEHDLQHADKLMVNFFHITLIYKRK